jgi:hypothetical protein
VEASQKRQVGRHSHKTTVGASSLLDSSLAQTPFAGKGRYPTKYFVNW